MLTPQERHDGAKSPSDHGSRRAQLHRLPRCTPLPAPLLVSEVALVAPDTAAVGAAPCCGWNSAAIQANQPKGLAPASAVPASSSRPSGVWIRPERPRPAFALSGTDSKLLARLGARLERLESARRSRGALRTAATALFSQNAATPAAMRPKISPTATAQPVTAPAAGVGRLITVVGAYGVGCGGGVAGPALRMAPPAGAPGTGGVGVCGASGGGAGGGGGGGGGCDMSAARERLRCSRC